MAKEESVEENGRTMITDSSLTSREPSDLYWLLPSYAEAFKKDVKNIIENEKAKLCNKQFKICFENVEFKLAFANSRNIKQMVVRTKL